MEDGKPWMVYAHEWIQKIDGTMEAIPLTNDLTAAAGDPIYLFKASDAPWYDTESTPNTDQMPPYVTDGRSSTAPQRRPDHALDVLPQSQPRVRRDVGAVEVGQARRPVWSRCRR